METENNIRTSELNKIDLSYLRMFGLASKVHWTIQGLKMKLKGFSCPAAIACYPAIVEFHIEEDTKYFKALQADPVRLGSLLTIAVTDAMTTSATGGLV
ncbi:hypothetical protein EVAR_8179_1 [Eumeta japonica]|uniref:Uncharacterized protein n=1 Tax=Eumeta variegata TaxID=151549 RepID=A0A4C1TFF0_EUMVA|nr:hypothetical protein EVAR_8179_1 [Eumeta japonica]